VIILFRNLEKELVEISSVKSEGVGRTLDLLVLLEKISWNTLGLILSAICAFNQRFVSKTLLINQHWEQKDCIIRIILLRPVRQSGIFSARFKLPDI